MCSKLATLLFTISIMLGNGLVNAQAPAPPYKGPIFDVHLHGDVPRVLRPNPVTGADPAGSIDELIARITKECERLRIVRAVVSGSLASLKSWKQADPDRYIAAPMILRGTAIPIEIAGLRAALRDGAVIGEITAQYSGLAPADPVLAPYWRLAEELDVPAMIHTGSSFPRTANNGAPGFRVRLGDPLLLEDVLVSHPRLRVWLAHGGLPFEQELFALLAQYPEVHIDISAINWLGGPGGRIRLHKFLQAAIERGHGKRIMFGSDAMAWPDAIALAIESVDSAPSLTSGQKADIFYGNAMRFFRLASPASPE